MFESLRKEDEKEKRNKDMRRYIYCSKNQCDTQCSVILFIEAEIGN